MSALHQEDAGCHRGKALLQYKLHRDLIVFACLDHAMLGKMMMMMKMKKKKKREVIAKVKCVDEEVKSEKKK